MSLEETRLLLEVLHDRVFWGSLAEHAQQSLMELELEVVLEALGAAGLASSVVVGLIALYSLAGFLSLVDSYAQIAGAANCGANWQAPLTGIEIRTLRDADGYISLEALSWDGKIMRGPAGARGIFSQPTELTSGVPE